MRSASKGAEVSDNYVLIHRGVWPGKSGVVLSRHAMRKREVMVAVEVIPRKVILNF